MLAKVSLAGGFTREKTPTPPQETGQESMQRLYKKEEEMNPNYTIAAFDRGNSYILQ
jgi:hypothetical protein